MEHTKRNDRLYTNDLFPFFGRITIFCPTSDNTWYVQCGGTPIAIGDWGTPIEEVLKFASINLRIYARDMVFQLS